MIKLFHTIIDSSTYNLDINNSCTVTVTLLDYNNNPISGVQTSISCTDGTLKDMNETLTGSNNYTDVTDINGQIKVKYKATNWGLHHLNCNNESIGIWIIGKKTFIGSVSSYKVHYSRSIAQLEVTYATLKGTNGSPTTVATISKDDIRPLARHTTFTTAGFATTNDADSDLSINTDGTIEWRCYGNSSGSTEAQAGICYARKSINIG